MMIGNAYRFLRFSVKCLFTGHRYRHQRHDLTALMAGVFGGLILGMPVWMLILGII